LVIICNNIPKIIKNRLNRPDSSCLMITTCYTGRAL